MDSTSQEAVAVLAAADAGPHGSPRLVDMTENGTKNSDTGPDEGRAGLRIPAMNDMKCTDVIGLLGPLRRYARSLTRDETRAEDLVHDTLVRAYERQRSFQTGGNLRGWLLSILHNTFIDGRRRDLSETRRIEQASATLQTVFPAEQENRLRLQQIQAAFTSLPDEQRAALHLVAIEGLSYQDAAGALGIPVGTLMSRLGRARAALRAYEAGADAAQASPDNPRPNLRIIGGSDV
jgi:RNA polymerase sigma-70 factor (ECF subfamily)